jgi:ribosome maturation factor RimP
MSAQGTARDAGIEHEVEEILARALPAVDLLEVVTLGRNATLRLVVDHPDGVDHGVCVDVTRALEDAGLLSRYAVEVWSPGPEPPLRTPAHFARAVGSRVRVEVDDAEAPRGRRVRTGRLLAADGTALTIEDGAGGDERVPVEAVRRARIVETTAEREQG